MSERDYYDVLGVARDADDAAIKKAYRRLAMKFHPDRNPDDTEAEKNFKEAKQAYEVLSDNDKRAAYDQFGHAGVNNSFGGGPNMGGFNAEAFGDLFGNVFGDIFGGRGGARSGPARGQPGNDLRYELALDLAQAAEGDSIEISVPRLARCDTCSGSGAEPGTQPVNCETCGGMGQVRMQQGFFAIQQTCPRCHGQGQTVASPCHDCHGQGRKQETKTLSVKIPPGVDDGDRIRLGGEGEAGRFGGPTGDLYVEVRLKPHPLFTRKDADLHCEVPLPFATAALGGEVTVPTLQGEVSLKIPAGTQAGKVFRLRDKGVPTVRRSQPGDLYCTVAVETPINLTSEQKDLIGQLQQSLQSGEERHNPQRSTWLRKTQAFFERFR